MEIELDNSNKKCEQLENQNSTLQRNDENYIYLIRDLEVKLKAMETETSLNAKKDANEEPGSGESNASNGWSDMDIGDLEGTKEESVAEVEASNKQTSSSKPLKVVTLGKKNKATKDAREAAVVPEAARKLSVTEKSRASSIDIFEVVNLKSELRKVEAERDDLKRELANEQKNREVAEQNLENLKKTLGEKKADLEIIAKDKDYFRNLSETANQKCEEYVSFLFMEI